MYIFMFQSIPIFNMQIQDKNNSTVIVDFTVQPSFLGSILIPHKKENKKIKIKKIFFFHIFITYRTKY